MSAFFYDVSSVEPSTWHIISTLMIFLKEFGYAFVQRMTPFKCLTQDSRLCQLT